MDGMVNGGGTNPAIPASDGAVVRQIGRGAMSGEVSKDRRVKSLVWVVLIAAAVVALLIAAPPTRIDAVSWTGWTMA
jgi:hypothetical protein